MKSVLICLQQQINAFEMASLLITLDKEIYLAGDTVSGQVLLAVPAAISGSQGISLHFAAFQSLKSVQPHQIQASSNIPLDQVYHTDKIQVSQCASEQNSNSGLRPKYIRTANNTFYEVKFSEQRNEFAKATVKLMEGGKIAAGHYSFPFSFKTFEEWPGSFRFDSPEKKAQICYRLTTSVDPVSPHFDFQASKEVFLLGHQLPDKKEFSNEVTSFFCLGKGRSSYSLAWAEDIASPSSTATIVMSIDNSECTADIKRISLSLKSSLILGQGSAEKSERVIYTHQINGLRAGQKCIDDKVIRETIDLSKLPNLPSETKGKYINSSISLSLTFIYDSLFYSANSPTIPLKLASSPEKTKAPSLFSKDFKPKSMPAVTLALQSSFKNPNMTSPSNFASSEKFHPQ